MFGTALQLKKVTKAALSEFLLFVENVLKKEKAAFLKPHHQKNRYFYSLSYCDLSISHCTFTRYITFTKTSYNQSFKFYGRNIKVSYCLYTQNGCFAKLPKLCMSLACMQLYKVGAGNGIPLPYCPHCIYPKQKFSFIKTTGFVYLSALL